MLTVFHLCRAVTELGLDGVMSPDELGKQWEHFFHNLVEGVQKCEGAEEVTRCLKDMGIPQVWFRFACRRALRKSPPPKFFCSLLTSTAVYRALPTVVHVTTKRTFRRAHGKVVNRMSYQ